MDVWAAVVIAGLVGFGIGALVVWWIGRRQVGGTSVSALKQEHEQFREQVTTHFVETAELINRLTDSYKDVFDHLSKGAETLVDDKSLRDRMPQVSDQEVRLKRIGTRPSADAGTGHTASGTSSTARASSDASGSTSSPSSSSSTSSSDRPSPAASKPASPDSAGKSGPSASESKARSEARKDGSDRSEKGKADAADSSDKASNGSSAPPKKGPVKR